MNTTRIVFVAAALAAINLFSADKPSGKTKLTPEQREERRIERLKKDGGKILLPGTMKGCIRFVDAQKRVADFDGGKLLRMFSHSYRYNAQIVKGEPVTLRTAAEAKRKIGADICIFIVDDAALPAFLTVPEEQFAIVNVARLAADKPEPAYLAARTRKEVIRAFAWLTASSTYDAPIMGEIRKLTDLDDIVNERYPVDVTMRLHKYLTDVGVTEAEYETYRYAIENGIEVAPTNSYQEAIYKEIKAKKAAK